MEAITTIKDYDLESSFKTSLKRFARNNYIRLAGLNRSISNSNNWVRFPLYHHVFDDEKRGFKRQLKYLKNFGDFISIDEAADLIDGGSNKIDGRYFCVTFDDGFENCYHNMVGITVDLKVPTIIYIPSDWISLDANNPTDLELLKSINPDNPKYATFLSEEQCKEMLQENVSFGTHTRGHVNIGKLSDDEIEVELRESKAVLDRRLGIDCKHYAVCWGKIDVDYNVEVTERIAKRLGYQTVVSSNRGKNVQGDSLFTLKRDHLLANWSNYQLKYFFSL